MNRLFLIYFALCPLMLLAGDQEQKSAVNIHTGHHLLGYIEHTKDNLNDPFMGSAAKKLALHLVDSSVCEQLLPALASTQSQEYQFNLLHFFAAHSNQPYALDAIHALLHSDINRDARDKSGRTALHILASKDSVDPMTWQLFLDEAIKEKMNLNAKDNNGNTVLHLLQDLKQFQPLILAGACTKILNKCNRTPLEEQQLRFKQCNRESLNACRQMYGGQKEQAAFRQRELLFTALTKTRCACHDPGKLKEAPAQQAIAASSSQPVLDGVVASASSSSLSSNGSSDDEASDKQANEKHGILKQSDNVVFFMGGGPESSDEEEGDAFSAQDKGKRKMNRNALRASTFGADTDYADEDDLTSSIPHDERKGIALDERTSLPLDHPVNSDKFFN